MLSRSTLTLGRSFTRLYSASSKLLNDFGAYLTVIWSRYVRQVRGQAAEIRHLFSQLSDVVVYILMF